MYDVFIIGSGVSGGFIALELSKYNLKVALCEKSLEPCGGSSRANSGIVHAGYDPIPGTLKAKLNVRGSELMPEMAKRLNIDLNICGSYVIAFNDADDQKVYELYKRGITNNVADMSILSGDAVRKAEPNISDKVTSALYARTTGIISPYKIAITSSELAAQNGVEFLRGNEVIAMEDMGGYIKVITNKGSYDTQYVVNAAGVYADKIANMLGDNSFGIIPRKGEYLILDKNESGIVNSVIFQVPSDMGKGILVAPTVDGNVLLGPTSHNITDRDDKSTTKPGIAEAVAGAKRSVPTVNERALITMFAGIRAVPSTGDFIIGQSAANSRLFNAAGIESPGLTSSPAIGEYVVKLMAESGVVLEKKKQFFVQRPAEKKVCSMPPEEACKLIESNPSYGKIVCRCEKVTEGEIIDAIHRPAGAVTLDGVKMRVRAGMGRCQGGFCTSRVIEILSRELNVPETEIRKQNEGSELLYRVLRDPEAKQ